MDKQTEIALRHDTYTQTCNHV